MRTSFTTPAKQATDGNPRQGGAPPIQAIPVAVVGASCRLPGGVDSAAALWDLVRNGRDAVTKAPTDRWSEEACAALEREASRPLEWVGGFLGDDLGAFDAEFFGISQEEAKLIDPQHRLLLEVTWEACEHAGIPTAELSGTRTGVFTGLCNPDYVTYSPWLPQGGGPYFMTGNQFGTAPGRVSHLLGLRGPSVALDTSCSSGLVAAHLACQSLQTGESDLALAGAANLLLSPRVFSSYNEFGVLSPTGRCKSFDESADGYVRAEGCVVLVLKRLEDAVRDQDRVLAVLRGTAVNHDGRTSRFALPSAESQCELFRTTLARAGVDPATVGLIEAHGTGTKAGDRIELSSLATVYGEGSGRCALGSVKSNLGHTEAAAGMVGLLKAVLAVQHGEVPASLHFRRLPPEADGTMARLFVPTQTQPWPIEREPRIAAVCSYGVGGTNSHAVVEEPPAPPPTVHLTAEGTQTYLVSAGSPTALEISATRLAEWLEGPGSSVPLQHVAHTLALRRTHAAERLAVLARSRDELISCLRGYVEGTPERGVISGFARDTEGRGPVWVFSGHGSQWVGMGRDLLDHDPVFADAIAEVDPLVVAESGFSPYEWLKSGIEATRVDQVQPLIFTMQVALARVLRARGVEPSAVVGHSMGEVAAAVVAGGLDLRDGVKVICRRSLQCVAQSEAGTGAMGVVELAAEQVRTEVESLSEVDVAMVAAPRLTVISGSSEHVLRLVTGWQARGIAARMVAVDFASHCTLTAPLARALGESLHDLRPLSPTVPFYTTVLPDPRTVPVFDAAYWTANMRDPVRAADATRALVADGYQIFQEISPHPVATQPLTETLEHLGVGDVTVVLPTLRAKQDGLEALNGVLAALHCSGQDVHWERWYSSGVLAEVPPTSWDRQRHLIDMDSVRPGTHTGLNQTGSGEQGVEPKPADACDLLVALDSVPTTSERRSLIHKYLNGQLRALLHLRARRISPSAQFAKLGLDSLHAMRLRSTLQNALGIAISLAEIWNHATLESLSAYLCENLASTKDNAQAVPPRRQAVPPPPPRQQPLLHQSDIVELPTGRFHYVHWGASPNARTPVVLLHANSGSAASWSRVGPALAERFAVFSLDLRGHGASSTPEATCYGLRAVADDVADFMRALGLKAPLVVGHSWGAAVALVLASGAETDRPAPVLSGLVLEDPPPVFSPARQGRELESLTAALAMTAPEARESLLAMRPEWDPADRESLVEGWRQASRVNATRIVDDGSLSGPLLPLIANVAAPTLLLRADPRCGGMLADSEWAQAQSFLPTGSTAINMAEASHEIHRSRFDDFMAAVWQFTEKVISEARL
ncbi:acyl transferase domain-containing protein [Streptomyces sp. V4I23]|uniref:type I polyketide synthase n=1 Tax=Streptomyces sp. V4I23 TaxID=3042282 RepID=UPI002789200B|nr:alpha/beta fold hydrolase [Streptomyces sp. V4I23]MDQ1005523.1 acyl transferase domain-containing protein [Streptomyces sp. V4I23]